MYSMILNYIQRNRTLVCFLGCNRYGIILKILDRKEDYYVEVAYGFKLYNSGIYNFDFDNQ